MFLIFFCFFGKTSLTGPSLVLQWLVVVNAFDTPAEEGIISRNACDYVADFVCNSSGSVFYVIVLFILISSFSFYVCKLMEEVVS